ncbi:YCF48-related protein [Comamonas faecalis]|uniref:YCF48-related protein n=1 Tax=Comamonas faecalis TaxID=1387849 RepID=A0ABP7RDI1_9BURK
MRAIVGLAASALVAVAAVKAFSHRPMPPMPPTRLAIESMQFDTIARSQAGLVIGGELGSLLYSGDQGKDWTVAKVQPERQALITQTAFAADGLRGLSVGHEGWILRTQDGGKTWKEVAFDEKNGEPFMGATYMGEQHWMVVGAFGRALRSDDDGQTWQPMVLPDAVADMHLNRVVGSADRQHWLIVGEAGLVLRSDDQGETWTQEEPFYNGSFYDALALPQGGWLVYGMRGHAFVQHDGGPWRQSEIPGPVSFYGHALLPDGRILLVGQGGVVATSTDGGLHFSFDRLPGRASLTDIALDDQGAGWITSTAGLLPYHLPQGAGAASSTAGSQ